MKEFLAIRQRQERLATLLGVVLAVLVPAAAALTLSFTGLKYIYPPPEETSFILDFTEEDQPKVKIQRRGVTPRAEEVDRTKSVELVQRSNSPYKAVSKNNSTPATKPDDFGDVDVPAVEQEDALDPRASFPGMSKKDTSLTAPHSAAEETDNFKAGNVQGNTEKGKADGVPNAHLKGRNTMGALPRPRYVVQNEGTVVVSIVVDRFGKVQKAVPGVAGTTVTDKNLWNEARKAAMETRFNQDTGAPQLQEGTITYHFKLK